MESERFRRPPLGSRFIVRAIGGVALLLAVIIVLLSIIGGYSDAIDRRDAGDDIAVTTSTLEPTGTTEPTASIEATTLSQDSGVSNPQKTVIVLVQDLKLRTGPSRSNDVIRSLDKDTRLTYLDTSGDWYHVKDASGTEGYVAAGGHYSKLVTE